MSTHTNIGGNDPAWPYLRARLNEKDIRLENSADYMAVLKAMHDYAESRQQADPSVLVSALQEILDGATPTTTMGFITWVPTVRTIALKALTTYKESIKQ